MLDDIKLALMCLMRLPLLDKSISSSVKEITAGGELSWWCHVGPTVNQAFLEAAFGYLLTPYIIIISKFILYKLPGWGMVCNSMNITATEIFWISCIIIKPTALFDYTKPKPQQHRNILTNTTIIVYCVDISLISFTFIHFH